MMHSDYYELVKAKYDTGKWNERMLRALVAAGKITKAEYAGITVGGIGIGETGKYLNDTIAERHI